MKDDEEFRRALKEKHVPLLVLDQKWHRLFAVHGKTDEIKDTESELNSLLSRQGKLNTDLKNFKALKNQLMESIVQDMESSAKKREEDKLLLDETNEKIDEIAEELTEIPEKIRQTNDELMFLSMEYFYEKLRVNKEESDEIEAWITQVRIDLKKNIIRKQNRDINNREIYAYLHDIFGARVIDMFDLKFEEENETDDENDDSENAKEKEEG
jgi:seryl-tRNA synthetase